MLRILNCSRSYCKLAAESKLAKIINNGNTAKIDFKTIKNRSKVPLTPIVTEFNNESNSRDIEIDSKTIQLLERLSLVDLDSKAALETLKSSIQFADKITNINTDNVAPLYSVLEKENLQLREDIVSEGNCRIEVLSNAKITDEDYFVSPPGNIPLEQEEKNFEDSRHQNSIENEASSSK